MSGARERISAVQRTSNASSVEPANESGTSERANARASGPVRVLFYSCSAPQVRAMVDEGFLAAGYNHVAIDDCWLAGSRDDDGNLLPDLDR